jgi:hypothetical protein
MASFGGDRAHRPGSQQSVLPRSPLLADLTTPGRSIVSPERGAEQFGPFSGGQTVVTPGEETLCWHHIPVLRKTRLDSHVSIAGMLPENFWLRAVDC